MQIFSANNLSVKISLLFLFSCFLFCFLKLGSNFRRGKNKVILFFNSGKAIYLCISDTKEYLIGSDGGMCTEGFPSITLRLKAQLLAAIS